MTSVDDPKEKGFFNRPRAGGKTIWNWLNLLVKLAIPLVVVLATIAFGIQQANLAQQQHDADQQRATVQQQAAILQTYIDNIQDLLLNHNLLGDAPKPKNDADKATIQEVQELARARTLTALQGLSGDPERKGRLLIFLHEADLIGFADNNGKTHGPIIDLRGANLTSADLTHISLTSADLTGANLTNANLTDDTLTGANLIGAILSGADLTNATLQNATL